MLVVGFALVVVDDAAEHAVDPQAEVDAVESRRLGLGDHLQVQVQRARPEVGLGNVAVDGHHEDLSPARIVVGLEVGNVGRCRSLSGRLPPEFQRRAVDPEYLHSERRAELTGQIHLQSRGVLQLAVVQVHPVELGRQIVINASEVGARVGRAVDAPGAGQVGGVQEDIPAHAIDLAGYVAVHECRPPVGDQTVHVAEQRLRR